MRFGALGDIHGDFASVVRIMGAHPDVAFWISVGDLADAEGHYQPVPAPLYWIKGNNENFDAIASGHLPANLRYLPNATLVEVESIRLAGVGGTFAPSVYDTAAADLPHPVKRTRKATELADRRRHFVREEVEIVKALPRVDILLTHEAPRPYRIGPVDAGKTPVNDLLAAVQPRLHLFGHHHRFSDDVRQGVRSVGLDLVSRSYLLIDAGTFAFQQLS